MPVSGYSKLQLKTLTDGFLLLSAALIIAQFLYDRSVPLYIFNFSQKTLFLNKIFKNRNTTNSLQNN